MYERSLTERFVYYFCHQAFGVLKTVPSSTWQWRNMVSLFIRLWQPVVFFTTSPVLFILARANSEKTMAGKWTLMNSSIGNGYLNGRSSWLRSSFLCLLFNDFDTKWCSRNLAYFLVKTYRLFVLYQYKFLVLRFSKYSIYVLHDLILHK